MDQKWTLKYIVRGAVWKVVMESCMSIQNENVQKSSQSHKTGFSVGNDWILLS